MVHRWQLVCKSTTQRIDEFEDNHTAYNTQPVVIGYEQQLFGYNSLKWDRRIRPLRYREARKAYAEALELVASETSTLSSTWLLHKPILT